MSDCRCFRLVTRWSAGFPWPASWGTIVGIICSIPKAWLIMCHRFFGRLFLFFIFFYRKKHCVMNTASTVTGWKRPPWSGRCLWLGKTPDVFEQFHESITSYYKRTIWKCFAIFECFPIAMLLVDYERGVKLKNHEESHFKLMYIIYIFLNMFRPET